MDMIDSFSSKKEPQIARDNQQVRVPKGTLIK